MNDSARSSTLEVLLVDDCPGNVGLVEEALRTLTPAVALVTAGDGERAISLLRGDAAHRPLWPHLILLDLNLPGISGWEVLELVKHDPELLSIPVVVVTSSESVRDLRRAYALHANCCVTKPVELAAFRRTIRSVVQFWAETASLPWYHRVSRV